MADNAKPRERWSSPYAFYFAAVGAAVGYGNVWRFPSLAADYGGGAFFIPYLLALFLIGIPVLILEISLGQYYQTGDVGVFGSFHKRFRGVGVASVSCAYMLVIYYNVLIAWVAHAFFDSFGNDHPWAKSETTGKEASDYFFEEIIGTKTLGDDGRPTRLVGANVAYAALIWFLMWAGLAGGNEWTGRITYFTMGLPIVLLFVFLGRALSLEGAKDGIKQYVGEWDVSVLTDRPDAWSTAVSQIFFSIGVTFGIMTAYGSYNDRNDSAVKHSLVIAVANSMFSIISGFAVFASLGHLAHLENKEVSQIDYGGFSLVFGTWPVVLGTLPGGIHWVRLLFFDLILLGLDSGFGFLEGPITVLVDSSYLKGWGKSKVAAFLCTIAFGFCLIYCTDAGLTFLDVIDFYINFVMLLVGFLETFAAGWVYGLEDQIAKFGSEAVFCYFAANFGSIILASGLWFGLEDNAVWGGFLALVLSYFTLIGVTAHFLNGVWAANPDRWESKGAMWWDLAFGNVMDLVEKLRSTIGYLPSIFGLMMRQFIPHVLLILFFNLAQSKTDGGDSKFGHYGDLDIWPYQVLGYVTFAFACFIFLIGLAAPDAYSSLALVNETLIAELECKQNKSLGEGSKAVDSKHGANHSGESESEEGIDENKELSA